MPRIDRLSLPIVLATALILTLASISFAQSPTISTDKDDYVPGEIVHISGSGWLPGETVMMILFETPETEDVRMLSAVADASGSFTNEQFSPIERDLGVTFTLVATGQTSGWTAQTVFTDGPKVGSVSVASQSPAQLCPGSSATYTVTVNRGTGPGSSGNFTAGLSMQGALPAGVSASFAPASLSFAPTVDSRTATLTLTSSASTPQGPTPFTVRAFTSALDFAEGSGSLTIDTQAPSVSAPAAKIVAAGPGCQASIPDLRSTVVATDNCSPTSSLVVTQSPGPGTMVGLGTTSVTFTVSDQLGNSASATTSVSVVDQTPPTIALLGANPFVLEAGHPFVDPGANASDDCAGALPVSITGSVVAGQPGSYTVTYTANDGHGNSASVARTVNVVDTTPPALALAGLSPMTVECHTSFTDPGATASDIVDGDLSGSIQVSGSVDVNTPGSYTLTYQVSDGHGNASSISRTVNVVDTTAPTLALSGGETVTVECHTSFSDPGATASDLCAGDLSGAIQVSGTMDVNTPGSYTLSYQVSDGHGNGASASRTVNVVDTTAPTLTLSGAETITAECHTSFSDPGATASDLCAGDLSGAIQVSGSVDVNAPGSYTLTYQVNDGHGNGASASRTVNVIDTAAPTIALSGAETITVECHTSFSDPGATASDLCAGDVSGAIQVAGSVDVNTPGSYTLSYQVSDGHGNGASASRTVNVVDTTPPVLSVPGAIQASTGPSATVCGAVVALADLGNAGASDVCAGALSVERSGVPDGGLFPVGTTTITYRAMDPSGNVATATQSVTVLDNAAPTITCPANIVQVSDAGQCAAVVRFAISVNDNCPGAIFSATPESGSSFAVGTTTPITVTATDASGNTSTCSFDVQVVNPAPVVAITGPQPGAVFPIGTPVSFTGSFTDNPGDVHTAEWTLDGKAMPGTVNEATGGVSLSYAFANAGVYTITLAVKDQCGGTGTAAEIGAMSAMVVIYDPSAGFVTGGGWIASPAGAYRPDTTLTGKANFGFVSKYKKGTTTPTGETEFQFKAGSLNFHSDGYDWLVVAGSRAQFKGWGTVNGTADFGFLLTAVDGDVSGGGKIDKFRIKIWKRADGQIVYDNQFGAADTSGPSMALGGGSIVITSTASANRASLLADPAADLAGGSPSLSLAPASPNPFRQSTMLRFSLGTRSRVTVVVYDAAGREVGRPQDGEMAPGSHAVAWPGRSGASPSSGVYFVRLTAVTASSGERFVKQQSLVLVR